MQEGIYDGDSLTPNRHLYMIDELIKFAKRHPGLAEISERGLRTLFETYKKTTLIYRPNGEIKGFAVYQEWPDCLNFIVMAGDGDIFANLSRIRGFIDSLPKKPIVFFDEKKMELRTLCHQQQQQ